VRFSVCHDGGLSRKRALEFCLSLSENFSFMFMFVLLTKKIDPLDGSVTERPERTSSYSVYPGRYIKSVSKSDTIFDTRIGVDIIELLLGNVYADCDDALGQSDRLSCVGCWRGRAMRDLTPFAEWLKRRRKSLDLTREALAKRAHCSPSTLRRLEAGDLRASKQLAESLAVAIGIPPDQREAFVKLARGDSTQYPEFGSPTTSVPPPPTLYAPPPNVPAPLTRVVGRKREIAAVCDLLRHPGVRLLTLTGSPGTGKTRLSIAVANAMAEDFLDGAHFIPLAPISDPGLIAPVIAQTLGVCEVGGGVVPSLREFLHHKRLLLVLDNFEQVAAAAPLISDLLTAASGVKALVTSREVLRVYGEHEFPVPPLALPDVNHLPTAKALSYYARYSSIQLFKERAHAAKPDFQLMPDNTADIARICAWLDGLPLAIEMAAAQVKWLPTNKLFEQLSNRLAALTGGPRDLSPRHQSLRGAIDWSYNLLDPQEKRLFNVMGVFVGGCDEEAILDSRFRTCDSGLPIEQSEIENQKSKIRNLVEKSLLRHELTPEGESRYSMLETIRDYAQEKLQGSGGMERARQVHAEYYSQLAQVAKPHLTMGGEQLTWLNRLEREHNNLRTALTWATESPTRYEFALALAEAMHHFWFVRGYLSEGRRWLEAALALDDAPTELRARVLNRVGEVAQKQGDYGHARTSQEQALVIQKYLGDELGISRSLEDLAILAGSQGDYARAGELLEQALVLKRRIGDAWMTMSTLNNLALVARRQGDRTRAEQLYRECAEICQAMHQQKSLAHALHGLAEIRVELRDYAAALTLFRECIALRHELGNRPELVDSLGGIAMVFYYLNDGIAAARLLSASARLREETGKAITPANRAEIEGDSAQVRAQIGEPAFAQAWAEGQAISLDEAVALAVGNV
jgi:predicted ATPase/transcriptional regulator with XRE-family HTH domain